MNWKLTLAICVGILLLASLAVGGIFISEPTAQRSSATKRSAMLVELSKVEQGTFRPTIVATGTVRPEQEISLSPRVSGQVISLAENFTPGGYVAEGEILLQIDPADYETLVLQRRSELHQAEAELAMEAGRQEQARRDYEELKGTISDKYRTLVLREPQLNAAEAIVESAEAALRQAELDLERTRVRAPFPAHVLSREAHVGSQVTPNQVLGQLVGVEAYWVEASVPVSSLRWIEFPENGAGQARGADAQVRNRAAWPENTFRTGKVDKLVGALESETRLARVLIRVNDPLAQSPESAGQQPLMVGSFVQVRIEGKPIENVIRMNRAYLRQNDTVWVMQDGLLRIVPVEVVFGDDNYVYIGEGLDPSAQVVSTNLATVVEGASLRLAGEIP
ncbi:MAG TPA: efflux RND transporter periplasmic adaptor subunit [Xanthomonadales bacterium]|nr:efflux RND transporter periplasmic adaptor subunit [Xanthomonadales bacterium]